MVALYVRSAGFHIFSCFSCRLILSVCFDYIPKKQHNLRLVLLLPFWEKMLGGNNGNPVIPMFLDENRFPYPTNASNQLQLFGNGKFLLN